MSHRMPSDPTTPSTPLDIHARLNSCGIIPGDMIASGRYRTLLPSAIELTPPPVIEANAMTDGSGNKLVNMSTPAHFASFDSMLPTPKSLPRSQMYSGYNPQLSRQRIKPTNAPAMPNLTTNNGPSSVGFSQIRAPQSLMISHGPQGPQRPPGPQSIQYSHSIQGPQMLPRGQHVQGPPGGQPGFQGPPELQGYPMALQVPQISPITHLQAPQMSQGPQQDMRGAYGPTGSNRAGPVIIPPAPNHLGPDSQIMSIENDLTPAEHQRLKMMSMMSTFKPGIEQPPQPVRNFEAESPAVQAMKRKMEPKPNAGKRTRKKKQHTETSFSFPQQLVNIASKETVANPPNPSMLPSTTKIEPPSMPLPIYVEGAMGISNTNGMVEVQSADESKRSKRARRKKAPPLPIPEPETTTGGDLIPVECKFASDEPMEELSVYGIRQKKCKITQECVWTPLIEAAFMEALWLMPRTGRHKVTVNHRLRGRNELISDFIKARTTEYRTRKQVSSHIQVLKKVFSQDHDFMTLVNAPNKSDSGTSTEKSREKKNNDVTVPLGRHSKEINVGRFSDLIMLMIGEKKESTRPSFVIEALTPEYKLLVDVPGERSDIMSFCKAIDIVDADHYNCSPTIVNGFKSSLHSLDKLTSVSQFSDSLSGSKAVNPSKVVSQPGLTKTIASMSSISQNVQSKSGKMPHGNFSVKAEPQLHHPKPSYGNENASYKFPAPIPPGSAPPPPTANETGGNLINPRTILEQSPARRTQTGQTGQAGNLGHRRHRRTTSASIDIGMDKVLPCKFLLVRRYEDRAHCFSRLLRAHYDSPMHPKALNTLLPQYPELQKIVNAKMLSPEVQIIHGTVRLHLETLKPQSQSQSQNTKPQTASSEFLADTQFVVSNSKMGGGIWSPSRGGDPGTNKVCDHTWKVCTIVTSRGNELLRGEQPCQYQGLMGRPYERVSVPFRDEFWSEFLNRLSCVSAKNALDALRVSQYIYYRPVGGQQKEELAFVVLYEFELAEDQFAGHAIFRRVKPQISMPVQPSQPNQSAQSTQSSLPSQTSEATREMPQEESAKRPQKVKQAKKVKRAKKVLQSEKLEPTSQNSNAENGQEVPSAENTQDPHSSSLSLQSHHEPHLSQHTAMLSPSVFLGSPRAAATGSTDFLASIGVQMSPFSGPQSATLPGSDFGLLGERIQRTMTAFEPAEWDDMHDWIFD